MGKISDELREHGNGYLEQRNGDCEWLYDIADRIDAEMVELPKAVDGEPIHVGDTVYACDDPSLEYKASDIEYGRDAVTVGMYATGIQTYRKPSYISHTRPDSLERIADELEKMSHGCSRKDLHGIAKRVRKLAKEQGDE